METGFFSRKLKRRNKTIANLIKRIIAKERSKPVYESDEDRELIDNIRKAKAEWINANRNFEYVGEQGMVDYYTYNIKACQVRYEYYIKLAKQRGLSIDCIDEAGSITK